MSKRSTKLLHLRERERLRDDMYKLHNIALLYTSAVRFFLSNGHEKQL